ncbi:8-oxoguanine DNA glycosylase OGG fold protein [Nocardioides sediminis]|uniref:8-oxoguanine DNA glycosylase OGG fold protein n=1 Tax=Nocardioides sediminis TaxID=433648 RepID=UPI00131F0BAE|nr:hypothetical protein [Nocardioides sediminis]
MTSAHNAAFRRKAPDGFLPPGWVLERVRVGAQEGPTEAVDGFSAKTLGPQWWKERASQVEEAYSTLIKRGGGMIPWLGPAFFSKFLYFANGHRETGDENARCLILDARVARSLYLAGWSMAPTYRSETGTFSYNWYTETYVSYCQVLEGWTAEVGRSTADMFERALFQGSEPVTEGAKPS